jgi:hypothetical protein
MLACLIASRIIGYTPGMSILIVCGACDGTGEQPTLQERLGFSPMCIACQGTGAIAMENELVCAECRFEGIPSGVMVYQATVDTRAIWRCIRGHTWSAELAPAM